MDIGILIFIDKSEILVNNIYFVFFSQLSFIALYNKEWQRKECLFHSPFFYKYANDLKLNVNVGHSLIRITINCEDCMVAFREKTFSSLSWNRFILRG